MRAESSHLLIHIGRWTEINRIISRRRVRRDTPPDMPHRSLIKGISMNGPTNGQQFMELTKAR